MIRDFSHESQNQLLLVLNNWSHYILFSLVSYWCLTLHYLLLPLIWTYKILYLVVPEFCFLFLTLFQDLRRLFSLLTLCLTILVIILVSVKKIPNFVRKHIIPFPNFLFEDRFSSVSIGDNWVLIALVAGPITILNHEEKGKIYDHKFSDIRQSRK